MFYSKELKDIDSTKCFRISMPYRKILHPWELSDCCLNCQRSNDTQSRLSGLRLDDDRLKFLWMARLDVTRFAVEIPRSKDEERPPVPAVCSQNKTLASINAG